MRERERRLGEAMQCNAIPKATSNQQAERERESEREIHEGR
jgi:hypothetical protein